MIDPALRRRLTGVFTALVTPFRDGALDIPALEALIAACEELGIREMVAVISDKGAEASVALHEKLGFVEVGRMGRVGFKFGRWLGTIYLQKHLTPKKKRRSLFGR